MKRVLITRAASDAASLAEPLRAAGLEPVCVPLVERRTVAAVTGTAEWLLLTSPEAVRACAEAMASGWVAPPRVGCVGPGTAAEAEQLGLEVEVVAEPHTGVALALALAERGAASVLYPRAEHVAPDTREALLAAGIEVIEVITYRNIVPEGADDALRAAWPVNLATALSGSAAQRLAAALRRCGLDPVPVVVIGPSTATVAEAVGLPIAAIASEHSVQGVIQATLDAAGLGD